MINLMFDEENTKKHIGSLKKDLSLNSLKEASTFFLKEMKKYPTQSSYDVTAREPLYFKTISYTEYAGCLFLTPLQQELRLIQILDASTDTVKIETDFIHSFSERVSQKIANKYAGRKKPTLLRKNIVILPGSNLLKKIVCLNKLKKIAEEGDVVFKPHPVTCDRFIEELNNIFGEDLIAGKNEDLYSILLGAKKVYTTHVSESALYAVALGKEIEPIDEYSAVEYRSFFNINKHLFNQENPQEFVNKIMHSCKSGLISPTADPKWKDKIEGYLEYIHKERNYYKEFS